MPAPLYRLVHYRLLVGIAASLSLLLGACTAAKTTQSDAVVAQLPKPEQQQASADVDDGLDTETTIWQLIGIAKKPSKIPGPQTGPGVSPVLWQASLDTLNFADFDSQDPQAGLIVTKWYSPKSKPTERLRVTVFIKSRALRSDSLFVTVERQTRGADGQWKDSTVANDVANNLENDILEEARQIHIARIRADQ
ncbi:MAG TPA: DUF3576 domain-containing protein [Stellaceae bacterium]|nr:DUF3576 domain-containing protein [Stellaceae bacterium]